jgi:anaerobic selenocysteine-containing dehydrogenase
MERRNFFKILSTVSAGLATSACGSKSNQLIPLLVPDHEIVPGEEQWRSAVCTECGAGCPIVARVMEGERVIERAGKQFRERIATVKKIEGDGGGVCARGHATLQALYNPDRLRGPMKRSGERGKGEFKAISWDEALVGLGTHLNDRSSTLFLMRPGLNERIELAQNFGQTLTSSPDHFALERKAAAQVFAWDAVPEYGLAGAHYVLGVGADFLGGWVSPVDYARQYGEFRQGREGIRGTLIQAESRMSLTAASADKWLPVRPGFESQFLLAITKLVQEEKTAERADVVALAKACGIEEKSLRKVAHNLVASAKPLVICGASAVHTNSLDALVLGNTLNKLLGAAVTEPKKPQTQLAHANIVDAIKSAKVVLLDGDNPVYNLPAASGVREALANREMIVSFGNFIDDTSAYADFLLPDHHSLEAMLDVQPLYNTRPMKDILRNPGQPSQSQAHASAGSEDSTRERIALAVPTVSSQNDPHFDGGEQFPYFFQPYLSLQFHDGRGANLPWLQELPDPTSSAMWELPVEIDPQTAAKLSVGNGDRVRVESEHGNLEAWAYVNPAAIPGVVSMAIGQGHSQYGRYASGRGANPLAILAPVFEETTGVLATGATRVKLTKIAAATGEFIQFAPRDREQGPWGRG